MYLLISWYLMLFMHKNLCTKFQPYLLNRFDCIPSYKFVACIINISILCAFKSKKKYFLKCKDRQKFNMYVYEIILFTSSEEIFSSLIINKHSRKK